MLRERDVAIIRYIEKYGFITISQCTKMFFSDKTYGYDLARKRLAKLEKQGYFYSNLDILSNQPEKVFYIGEKNSTPTKHTILSMNVYSEIIRLSGEIIYFKKEQNWLNGTRRSDAYVLFKINDYIYQVFVEVEGGSSNKKYSRDDIVLDMSDKYSSIIESGEPKRFANTLLDLPEDYNLNLTTRILIIDNVRHSIDWQVPNQVVIQLDFTMSKFSQILI